jgi:hypothetical protein
MIFIITILPIRCSSIDILKFNEEQTKIDLIIPSVFCALLNLSHQSLHV